MSSPPFLIGQGGKNDPLFSKRDKPPAECDSATAILAERAEKRKKSSDL